MTANSSEATGQLKACGQTTEDVNGPPLRPVQGVLVRAYRDSEKLNDDTTGADGHFNILFDSGGPVELRYDHDSYYPRVAGPRPGDTDFPGDMVMTRLGTRVEISRAKSIVISLSRILAFDLKAGLKRKEIAKRYEKCFDIELAGEPTAAARAELSDLVSKVRAEFNKEE